MRLSNLGEPRRVIEVSEEILDLASKGLVCPSCLSFNVVCIGLNPDGMRENKCYDCEDCGVMWEGY